MIFYAGNFGIEKSFHSFAGRRIDVEERILSGAEELFCRYGIKSITMDDIAGHLGISKKTIYQFYKDKKELVHRSEEHTSELQSLMRISYAVFCLKKKKNKQ